MIRKDSNSAPGAAGVPAGEHRDPDTIWLKKGFDPDLPGAPEQSVHRSPPIRHLAVRGTDFIGLRPRMCVEAGAVVNTGEPLFVDKQDPAVAVTAPGTGTVVSIKRGERRALGDIVIRLDGSDARTAGFRPVAARSPTGKDRAAVVEGLARSGLWTAIRTRPFSRVPHSTTAPSAIFVTAIDTRPLAADPEVVIRPQLAAFEAGLRVLSVLTDGPLWLCTGTNWAWGTPRITGLRHARFGGPHPAGLAGTHIHFLHPVRPGRVVWQVGYQDVIAMGRLFGEGVLDFTRVVALGGEKVERPRLLRSRMGASLEDLVSHEIGDRGDCVLFSGPPLPGRGGEAGRRFLGRFDLQVSVMQRPPMRRAFGWWWRGRNLRPVADTREALTGMLPLERFEAFMPAGFLAAPLLRALMAGDVERARDLGCLELDEEDLALCAWACPARADYPGALRHALQVLEREGPGP